MAVTVRDDSKVPPPPDQPGDYVLGVKVHPDGRCVYGWSLVAEWPDSAGRDSEIMTTVEHYEDCWIEKKGLHP